MTLRRVIRGRLVSGPPAVWAATAGLALMTCALRWPGALIGDSIVQLTEIRAGRLTDWNPPLMAVIWRALGTTPQSMLVLQVALYWLGLGLLADQLRREGKARWGYAILLAGLTPMSLIYLGLVQKDTLLVALFILAAGVTARFGRAYGVVPALLGTLTRANAVFAFPPFLIRERRWLLNLALCLAVSLALIPVSKFVNLVVLGAERSHVEKSLQLFDIAGIQNFSGRHDLGPDISRCYTPFYWDALELDCRAFYKTPNDLTGVWIDSIRKEPLAYLQHRIVHFNHNIFFLVPPLQECVLVPKLPECGPGERNLLKDAVVRNAFLWPVTWLVAGIILLFMPLAPLARTLALSGVLYGCAYVIVGVASGFRYFYWTEFAVQIALVWQVATTGLPHWRWIAFGVLATWAVGYLYRFGPFLF